MPFTRKSGNTKVRTEEHDEKTKGNSRKRRGGKTLSNEQEKEETGLHGAKEEKGNKKDGQTVAHKKETSSKSRQIERTRSEVKDDKEISSKKRKKSDPTPSTEPTKRTKMAVPETISLRRSSRAVVPNSRYKDMETLDVEKKKKKSNAPSTSGITACKRMQCPYDVPNSRYKDMETLDVEKKKKKSNAPSTSGITATERTKEKKHGSKIHGVDVIEIESSASNIVSEEIITGETQIDESMQLNLMDNILVLPSDSIKTKPSDQQKDSNVNNSDRSIYSQSIFFSSQSNIVSEEIITCETKIDESMQLNLMDNILVLPPDSIKTKSSSDQQKHSNANDTGKHTVQLPINKEMDFEHGVDNSTDQAIGMKDDNSNRAFNATSVSEIIQKDSKGDFHDVKKDVDNPESIPSPNIIVIHDRKTKKPDTETNATAAKLPKVINVPKGVTIIKKVIGQTLNKANVLRHQGKTVKISPTGLKSNVSQKASMSLPNMPNPKVISSVEPKASTTAVTDVANTSTRVEDTSGAIGNSEMVGTHPVSNTEKLDTSKLAPANLENITANKETTSTSVDSTKPHVNVVYVKMKPKYSESTTNTLENYYPSAVVNKLNQENNHYQGIASITATSDLESFSGNTIEIRNDEIIEATEETIVEAIENGATEIQVSNPLEMITQEQQIATMDVNEPGTANARFTNEITHEQQIANMDVNELGTASASLTNEIMKPYGKVCEVEKTDDPAVDSPQVAIEYVVFGGRVVPIHKPFSQSNAGQYKKKTNTNSNASADSPKVAIEYVVFGGRVVPIHKPFSQSNAGQYKKKTNTNSNALQKIPVKIAQTAINSLLDGKPPNTAYILDTEEMMESETTNSEQADQLSDQDLRTEQETVETTTQETNIITSTDNTQQKPGRVVHGYVHKPETSSGPTEIVEISQDLFTKEVYGETAVLDHVTGEMVTEASLTLQNKASTSQVTDEANMAEEIPSNNIIIAGMVENNPPDSMKAEESYTNTSTRQENQDESGDPKVSNETFNLENLIEGEPVVLHIDENGVVLNETPAYRTLTDVKINPAVRIANSTDVSKMTEVFEGGDSHVEYRATPTIQIKPVTALERQKEMDTQTEVEEDIEGDVDSNVDYTDEPPRMTLQATTEEIMSEPIVVKTEQTIRRTTVVMEENGQVQEYVVVHLPEGAEIKQQEVKQSVKDPVHDEPVTQSADGKYFCVDCDHTTDRRGNWYKHRRKHLGIRPHACPQCSYKASTSSNLKRHMQIHEDVRNFECTICGLFFRQKIHLERHIKYKHQEKKVKCPLCDYMCSSESPDLKIHIRRRHMPQEDGSMSAFTCNECGLMTVSKKDLKQHMKFHKRGPELKLFCEFCSFVTDCESRLRRHMLIHTREKPFQCGLCDYRGTQKEHVLRHMKSQHDVVVERKPRKSLLNPEPKPKPRRSLLEETGADGNGNQYPLYTITEPKEANKLFEKSDYSCTDKIFACNHCSMKFSKLINLYKHLFAQHKQVMPDTSNNFQCVVCDFRTNNKKNLLVHMRKHNLQDHSPPTHVYSCVLCRYINPRRRNLFQHMKKKHNIQIIVKEDGSECFVTGDVVDQQDGGQGMMALSEIVATHPLVPMVDDTQLQIVTEDGTSFPAQKISIDSLISEEDISAYESTSSQESISSNVTTIPAPPFYQSTIAEHEAAEAIEGLQALAGQTGGVVETHPIDDTDISTEIISSEIMDDSEIMTTGEETLIEQNIPDDHDDGIELSSEQLNQLSAGDYVEINGEVYKVEIAPENAQK